MAGSPTERLLGALDGLDVGGVMTMLSPDARFVTADGRRAEGSRAVQALISDFLSTLRAMTHRITAQWHQDDAWIAEVEASYELSDGTRTGLLPRVFIVREGPDGVRDVRAYGANERPLTEHRDDDGGFWLGGNWIPPL